MIDWGLAKILKFRSKDIEKFILANRIKFHWMFITKYRKIENKLIDRGEPLTSTKLIKMTRKSDEHGIKILTLTELYKANFLTDFS